VHLGRRRDRRVVTGNARSPIAFVHGFACTHSNWDAPVTNLPRGRCPMTSHTGPANGFLRSSHASLFIYAPVSLCRVAFPLPTTSRPFVWPLPSVRTASRAAAARLIILLS
jgi:hypothetical protein